MSRELSKARRAYKKFHGRNPSRVSSVDFAPPKSLVYLGRAVAVEYESTKLLHGSHRLRVYRHKFGRGVRVLGHPGGKWLLIHGGKFRISDWLRG